MFCLFLVFQISKTKSNKNKTQTQKNHGRNQKKVWVRRVHLLPVSLCQQFVLALDSRFWSLAGTCKRALAGSLQKRPFTKGPEKGLAKHGPPKKNMKVMKAMKVKKAHLKRPSADLDLPKKDQGMSLEEKMELFKKKGNQDVSSFLDSLTKTQRESLWHKFSAARSALKDEESGELWGDIAKGKGSDPARKKLLATFLKMGGDLKGKREVWHKELLQYSKKVGHLAATGKAL